MHNDRPQEAGTGLLPTGAWPGTGTVELGEATALARHLTEKMRPGEETGRTPPLTEDRESLPIVPGEHRFTEHLLYAQLLGCNKSREDSRLLAQWQSRSRTAVGITTICWCRL